MLKELRGKLCAYCVAAPGVTPDHVFARGFLPPDKREGLPTVPACEKCNGEKAKLEHYLTAVLPFGARHQDAHENLESMVPARLEQNLRLKRELSAGADVTSSGGLETVPIDGEKLEELFGYIARGLAWHHWPEVLTPDHGSKVWCLTKAGKLLVWDEHFSKLLSPDRVNVNLGDDALVYEGARGKEHDHMSIWHFQFLGGAVMSAGDPRDPEQDLADIVVVVGKTEFLEKCNL